jgi:hypothetical protein
VLVNNAAVDYDTRQRGIDTDLAVVHQAFETNLFGAWRAPRALPLMERNGWGRIVNVSSEGGSRDGCRHTRLLHLEGSAECPYPRTRRRATEERDPRQRRLPGMDRD